MRNNTVRFKFIFLGIFPSVMGQVNGIVFLIPFVFPYEKINKATMRRLSIVIGFATLAAVFGWVMVASGLKDRPW